MYDEYDKRLFTHPSEWNIKKNDSPEKKFWDHFMSGFNAYGNRTELDILEDAFVNPVPFLHFYDSMNVDPDSDDDDNEPNFDEDYNIKLKELDYRFKKSLDILDKYSLRNVKKDFDLHQYKNDEFYEGGDDTKMTHEYKINFGSEYEQNV
jgi:hypothetical protein